MKKNLLVTFASVIAACFSQHLNAGNSSANNQPKAIHFSLPSGVTQEDYLPNTIIIRVKPEYRSACSVNKVNGDNFQSALASIGANSLVKRFPLKAQPASERNAQGQTLVDLSLIYTVNYSADLPIEKAITILLSTKMLVYAEPSYIYHVNYTPSDTMAATQYHLTNIHAYQGWDISKGDTNTVIGISDIGIDWDHPDPADNIKYNYADPINGVDDDGDGYIDNYRGWNMTYNTNDPGIINGHCHGTFVAGCSSASVDNITGIAGTGFKCKFLPIFCGDAAGTIPTGYESIVYAADHGVNILNCSWGGFGGGQYGQDIVNYATFNKNVLVVSAVGNTNTDVVLFPCAYENVLCVGGSEQTDLKSPNSSFNSLVDICAPGWTIISTWWNDTYFYTGNGTSFSTPIVSGCAGIVKSFFPSYNCLQVGERLRITADDIDTIPANAPYVHKLGKGRVNLYRALTDIANESVRTNSIKITDGNDNAFSGNDTLRISGVYTNYLDPATNLSITLTCSSPDITILNGTINPGAMASLAADSNRTNPFTALISPLIPLNSKVTFTLNYSDGTYSDWQAFDVTVNVDYINVLINDLQTTITSKGRLGFNDVTNTEGIGVACDGSENMLFSGSFMVGANAVQVSDATEGAPAGTIDENFVRVNAVSIQQPSVVSDFDLKGTFNEDAAYTNRLNVFVTHRAYAWSTPADSKYVIVTYTIRNDSSITYDSLYAGIFMDWDIFTATYAQDRAGYDPSLKMGYAWLTTPGGLYAGVKVLSPGNANCYAIDNDGTAGSLSIYTGGFDNAEKYQALSTPRSGAGLAGSGNDVSCVVSNGPYQLNPGDSITVAFAIMCGDSLPVLDSAAVHAQIKYDNIGVGMQELTQADFGYSIFPNPVSNSSQITFTIAKNSAVSIDLLDITGKKIRNLLDKKMPEGTHKLSLHPGNLSAGIYLCELTVDGKKITKKLTVQ